MSWMFCHDSCVVKIYHSKRWADLDSNSFLVLSVDSHWTSVGLHGDLYDWNQSNYEVVHGPLSTLKHHRLC